MQSSKVWSFVATSAAMVAAQAMGQQAVEWKVSEGGNGHWYGTIRRSPGFTRSAAQADAAARGGHLFTGCGEELNAAVSLADVLASENWNAVGNGHRIGPWIGLVWSSARTWVWVDSSSCVFDGWASGQPDNTGEDSAAFYSVNSTPVATCHDATSNLMAPSYLIEFDADCNGDGIVDYGQIRNGDFVDSNGNGVLDCCEDGSVCGASVTVNSGFESGSPLNSCAVESVAAGNLVASGWQVSAGVVDRVRGGASCTTSTQPRYGDYCVDLCGTPASSGAIKQIVPTIPAHRYRCTFSLSGDASAGSSIKKVHAKVGTYVDLTFTFACTGTGAQNWVSNQFEFTARGANEPLEFVADNGVTTGGPMLDAINLVDITTQCVGDLDASGEVDGADIALLLLNFGPCATGP